jgi:hypothetical protein
MREEHKGYAVETLGTFPAAIIRSIGKGALPKALKGQYTSFSAAKKAVDTYLRVKEDKVNGKKSSTTRSK